MPRPCILADDEGYNQEWSTELEVGQALDEYVKAWFALKIMAKVWHYGDPDGFVFNMSVGYDLEGIRGPKIDHYIESMKDASQLPVFAECRKVLTELFPEEADVHCLHLAAGLPQRHAFRRCTAARPMRSSASRPTC